MNTTDKRSSRPPPQRTADTALTPERWQQIKEVFAEAQDRTPAERVDFLEKACAGDGSLRSEVESLLVAAESEAAEEGSAAGSEGHSPVEDAMIGRRVGAYKIVQRIGRGGMATVYLASRADEQYEKQVAIKILLPELDSDDLLRRFRNERQTLAKLDHPNIVKLLDGGTTEEGLPYLVMDYVAGVPVDKYCDSHKFSTDERLRLFCQICAAVQCAHQNLIVHRDLKPSNILITEDGTPKLLDFGISKVLHPSTGSPITQTLTRRMTPAYASPEQVKGESVTPATDIYSLGVVLYELLTGHRPYKLKLHTPAEVERAICEQEPEKPSTAVNRLERENLPDGTTASKTPELVSAPREGQAQKLRRRLSGDLDNIVLMALQKEQRRRYVSVEEFLQDIERHLQHRPVKARRSTVAYRASKFVRRHKTEVIAGAVVAFILLGAIGFSVFQERRTTERALADQVSQRSGGRRSVAVLGFKNLSAGTGSAWLSTALSEMLTTELAAGGKLRLIPGEDVAQTRLNLSLPETNSFNAATLRRIYKNLGSDFVVVGSFVETGEGSQQVRLDLRVQDAVAGDTIAVAAENGNESDLSGLIARTGAGLREKLGVAAPSPSESAGTKASLPATSEAARLYAEGLEKQRLYDFLGARELLERAVGADPNFALAHLQLSDAWASYGDTQQAQEEARKALDLSAGLPREQSLMVEARYYEALHQWDKAIETRRTLFNFFPDNLYHGLQLAAVQAAGAKGTDSLATVESLHKLPVPERNDPRIDLAEALAANVVSDFKRQAVASEQAVQKARAIGARVLVARALIIEARAFMEMGQQDKAGPALAEAQEIFKAVGDRFHAARVLQQVGLALYYKGKFEEAKTTYEEALTIQRELGNRSNEAKLLNGIALVQEEQNDLDGAQQNYLRALALCREIDDRAMTGTVLGNLGNVEISRGNFQIAKSRLQESLDIARQVGDQSGIALQLENLALVQVAEGNLRAAKPLYEESLQISRQTGKNKDLSIILVDHGDLQRLLGDLSAARRSYLEAQRVSTAAGDQQGIGVATRALGEIQFQQGDLTAAHESFEQALAVLKKIGDTRFFQNSSLAMGRLELETGDPSIAERKARLASDEFRKAKDPDSQANAEVLLTRALLVQQKTQEAQHIAADAKKLAVRGSRATQIVVASVEAEVEVASGKATEAANSLRQIVSDARRTGLVPQELETRLALGEAVNKSGHHDAARALFLSLERDATAKGFQFIARKAAAARKGQ